MSVNHWSNIPHAQKYFLDTLLFFFFFFLPGRNWAQIRIWSPLLPVTLKSLYYIASLSSFSRLHSSSVWLSKANESSWWWRTILWNGAVFKRTKKRKCHGEGGNEEESFKKRTCPRKKEPLNVSSHSVTIVELGSLAAMWVRECPCRQTERVHGAA